MGFSIYEKLIQVFFNVSLSFMYKPGFWYRSHISIFHRLCVADLIKNLHFHLYVNCKDNYRKFIVLHCIIMQPSRKPLNNSIQLLKRRIYVMICRYSIGIIIKVPYKTVHMPIPVWVLPLFNPTTYVYFLCFSTALGNNLPTK